MLSSVLLWGLFFGLKIENFTHADVYRAKGNKEWNEVGRTHNLVTKIYMVSR